MSTIPTARDLRERLESRGVTGPAADLMVRLTAASRHSARVAAGMASADADGICGEPAEIAFFCVLDALGVGGHAGLSGGGTERHPLFAPFAASKQSGAGPAWDAAIAEARQRALVVSEDGQRRNAALVLGVVATDTLPGEILVCARLDNAFDADQVWSTEVLSGADPEEVNPAWRGSYRSTRRWMATLAGVAVARLSGVDPTLRNDTLQGVVLEGDVALWSELYARCVQPDAPSVAPSNPPAQAAP